MNEVEEMDLSEARELAKSSRVAASKKQSHFYGIQLHI